ncbi:beta barrel domain-containing protein [Paenibacillus odorifer]|uniref:beta barrel domain-containing protein n=1 Tax=Paenibacillus odorifer TaxID=189426 RepID=UPI0009D66DD7|nr:hypothetical protein [Paenibacillus odorifer]
MKTGDTVYLKAIGNEGRRHKEVHVVEYKIGKIGRKYFEVYKEDYESYTIKFRIESNRQHTDYSPDWELYFSMQEVLDKEESERLSRKLGEKFGSYGRVDLTLDQLRRISQIVNEQTK